MSPKLFRSDETKQWLRHAQEDLRAAEALSTAKPPLPKLTLFHCQQAVEKTLKAFLVWHEQSFERTHNLTRLGKQCVVVDKTLAEIILSAVGLTQYAVKFRYPGEVGEPTLEEAKDSLEIAKSLLNTVIQRLPEEVRLP